MAQNHEEDFFRPTNDSPVVAWSLDQKESIKSAFFIGYVIMQVIVCKTQFFITVFFPFLGSRWPISWDVWDQKNFWHQHVRQLFHHNNQFVMNNEIDCIRCNAFSKVLMRNPGCCDPLDKHKTWTIDQFSPHLCPQVKFSCMILLEFVIFILTWQLGILWVTYE